MRKVFFITAMALLATGPALAEPSIGQGTGTGTAKPARHSAHPAGTPLDRGPFTSEASRAYEGGGMVLQGAPGAPPPTPEPTPPGQTPRNMVPQ
jgi:hypothetical protein